MEQRLEQLEKKLQEQQDSSSEYPVVDGIGGRVQADWAFNVDESDNYQGQLGSPAEDGFEFRRVWLNASGSIARNVDFLVRVGLNDGATLQDVYIDMKDIPVLPHLKIGKIKEPYSISEQTPNNYLTFLERPNLKNAFSPGRQPGILTSNQQMDGKLNWAVGVFTRDLTDTRPLTSGGYDLAGRVTSPIYANSDFSRLVHLGVSAGYRASDGSRYQNSVGPEVRRGGADLLDVRISDVKNSGVIGLEWATVYGPVSLQGEYSEVTVNRTTGEEPTLESAYLMGSYFLTGEKRPYNPSAGAFGRVRPNDPYVGSSVPGGGVGAWEVALRGSSTDFSDAPDSMSPSPELNGEADIITLGLNWYPTSHTRWMLNYVDAQQQDKSTVDAQWVSTRFQVDF